MKKVLSSVTFALAATSTVAFGLYTVNPAAPAQPILVDLEPGLDPGFTATGDIIDQLWVDAWGLTYEEGESSIVLTETRTPSLFLVYVDGDRGNQGSYQEISTLGAAELEVDLSGQAGILRYDRHISVGQLVGSTGYVTAAYGYMFDVEAVSGDPGDPRPRTVRSFVPFGIEASISDATQAAMNLYEVIVGDSSSFRAAPAAAGSCEETCRNIFDLEVAQARADGIACALACTAGALTGVTACAAGSFFFFPVCAGTILLAQAVCEAGCWVARAADIKGHEANLLRCLAGCVPPVISPRPPAAEVGGSSITPR